MKNLLALFILLFVISACSHSQERYVNRNAGLSEIMDSLGIHPGDLSLHIDKSDYRLSLMADTQVLKQYPVVFGSNPLDDKLRQGDECTPEGRFKVLSKYPHRSWDKFIWIDYPNEESWRKHRQAKRDGRIPESASIGGEIGIHGVPEGTDFLIGRRINWTLGCISLRNGDINEFYPYISEGTQVTIER